MRFETHDRKHDDPSPSQLSRLPPFSTFLRLHWTGNNNASGHFALQMKQDKHPRSYAHSSHKQAQARFPFHHFAWSCHPSNLQANGRPQSLPGATQVSSTRRMTEGIDGAEFCHGAHPPPQPHTITTLRLARTPPPKPKAPAAVVEAPPLVPARLAQHEQASAPTGPAMAMQQQQPRVMRSPPLPAQQQQQPRVMRSPPVPAQQQQPRVMRSPPVSAQQQQPRVMRSPPVPAQQQPPRVMRSPPVPTLARIAAGLAAATEAPVAAAVPVPEAPLSAPPAPAAVSENEQDKAVETLTTVNQTTIATTTTPGEGQASVIPPLVEAQAVAPVASEPVPQPINQAMPVSTTTIAETSEDAAGVFAPPPLETTVEPSQQTQDVPPVAASKEVSPPLPLPSVAETAVPAQELLVKEPAALEVQKKVNFEEAAAPVHAPQEQQQQQQQESEQVTSPPVCAPAAVGQALPPSPPPVASFPPVSAAPQQLASSLPAMPAPAPATVPEPPATAAPSARSLIANILSSASSSLWAPVRTTTAASTTSMATASPRVEEQPLPVKASAPVMFTKKTSQPPPSLPAAHVAFDIRNFTQSMKKGAPVTEMKTAPATVGTQAPTTAMEEQEEEALDAPMVDVPSPLQPAESEAVAASSASPDILAPVPPAAAVVAAAAVPPSVAAPMEEAVEEAVADEDIVMVAKATLTQQEAELQDELAGLRESLVKQKAESHRLMESWTQAQEALKESGAELNGVQKERRRLSVDVSRLTRDLTTTKERIPPLVEETDKVRMEAHRVKLEQLKARCELTASVRAFDRLCERERRLKIKLLHQEAASYDARSTYLHDYSTMCSFGRTVSLKAFELMGRVKEGVGKVKGAIQVQRGELQKQAAEASKQAAQASKESAAEIARLENREADQQKELQRLEEGKKKAEKRLTEAEKRADEEVRRLESMVSSRGNEIKKLEDELKKLRHDGAKAAAAAAKAAKAAATTKKKAAPKKSGKKVEEEVEDEDVEDEEEREEEEEEEDEEEEYVPVAAAKAKGGRKRATSTAKAKEAPAAKKAAPSRQSKKKVAVVVPPVAQEQDVEPEQVQAVKAAPTVAAVATARAASSSPSLPSSLADAVDEIPNVFAMQEADADDDFEEDVLPISKRAASRASTNKRVVQEVQSEEQATQVNEYSPAAPPSAKRSRGASLSEPTQALTAMPSPSAPATTTTGPRRRSSLRKKTLSPVAAPAAVAPAPLGEQSKSAANEQAAPVAQKQPAAVAKAPAPVPRMPAMPTTKPAAKANTFKPPQAGKKNSIFSSFINKGAIPKLKKPT